MGAEALIRWKHPKRGMVLPDDFIPLAEETGLILPLGDWVLEAACAQIAAWAGRKQSAHLSVAVNISALQFRQSDFVEQVLAALERTGANPENLKLELTESMLVENLEDVIAKMTELKAHGLRFSLDDFGTGYSSLSYLKRLPLDLLKIDRAFVRDMLVDADQRRHCANHHFTGPRHGIVGDRRGRGNRRAAGLPRRSGLPCLPGIPVQPAAAHGRVRRIYLRNLPSRP